MAGQHVLLSSWGRPSSCLLNWRCPYLPICSTGAQLPAPHQAEGDRALSLQKMSPLPLLGSLIASTKLIQKLMVKGGS